MKKTIYLASRSKARKHILESLGIKCKVIPADIKEDGHGERVSLGRLVKNNALAKARHAAKKVSSGIIIAADTISAQGRNLYGKPESIAGARRMLKRLSGRPQDVYTGIAVIDRDRQIELTDYEKTRIYMDRLTDKEIRGYFSRVSPLNKAGSFDIQGRGAFFIRRIEGCFYNVVGLPVRKLYLMLKKLGVKIFIFLPFAVCPLVIALLSGCSSEYNIVTGQEESYYYSTDREVNLGRSIDKEIRKEYKFAEDPLLEDRVEKIGQRIAAVCDRKEIDYHFYVLDDDEVNAVSLPGGYIYVNRGLIEKVDNDDQLAGVIAHEVGHVVARHSIKKLQAMNAYSIIRLLSVVATPQTAETANAADVVFAEILTGYSRDDELLADRLGSRYAKLAGYDPHGMLQFLEKLQDISRRAPLREKTYFKTHPYVPDRIRVVKEELGEGMDFDDFINIEHTKYNPQNR